MGRIVFCWALLVLLVLIGRGFSLRHGPVSSVSDLLNWCQATEKKPKLISHSEAHLNSTLFKFSGPITTITIFTLLLNT